MKKIIVLAVFSFLFVVACKGPQGEVGPQGPQGLQGEKGATGAAGTNGTNGTNANSSVYIEYSKWTNYTTGWAGTPTSKRIENIKIYPTRQVAANQDILLVYVRKYMPPQFANWTSQILLPSEGFFFDRISYVLENGDGYNYNMAIYVFNSTTITNSMLDDVEFRWILIAPLKAPNGKLLNIDYSDYNAVKKAYNIPD